MVLHHSMKVYRSCTETYKDQLVIVGFPANNFGGQEPGSNEEIGAFAKKKLRSYLSDGG